MSQKEPFTSLVMQSFRDCHLYHINPWILW